MQVPNDLKSLVAFNEQGFLAEECRTVEWINPRSIKLDADSQLRDLTGDDGESVGVDETHVQSIFDSIADKALDLDIFGSVNKLPLVVNVLKPFRDGVLRSTDIVSGFHRVAALKKLKSEKIPVRVLMVPEGTSDSTLQAAVQLVGLSENEHSGAPLKMSKRDRLKTLKRMLTNPVYQSMSSTRLAELTGISDKTMTAFKKELGVDPSKIVTSDGKVRPSTIHREPRGESILEVLKKENDKLRRELGRYRAALKVFEDGLRSEVAYSELLERLVLWLSEESEGSTDPTVDSTPQLEDGTIIDVTPEPETVAPAPALPAPVVTVDEPLLIPLRAETDGVVGDSIRQAPSKAFAYVKSLIENNAGAKKSLNDLCSKNAKDKLSEMSESEVAQIYRLCDEHKVTYRTRSTGSRSKGE